MPGSHSKRSIQTESGPKRAALYPRVSDPLGERDGTSLDTQEAGCRRYATAHGYVVDDAHVYRETHTGVELWQRPKLTALRAAIRAREVDVVIVYAIDRLARDPVHLGVILTEAQHAGVTVEFVTEPLDNSPEGQLIRFVRGYAAKVEHEKIKERTMRGKRARAEAGKLIPGWKPRYGYRFTADRTRYEIDPATAPIVQGVYAAALRGRSIYGIACDLTDDGVLRPAGPDTNGQNGTRWGQRTVWLILTNPIYAGDAAAWRDSHTGPAISLPAGTAPALVDRATFDAVQTRLAQNKQRAARNNRDPEASLLRGGYARCGHCGWTLHVYKSTSHHKPDGTKYATLVYRCSRGQKPGYAGTCTPTIAVRTLDAAAWARVAELLTHPETIAAELERMQRDDPTAADLESTERALTAVVREQRNLIENLGHVRGAAAVLITDKINTLAAQRAQYAAERDTILAHRPGWQATLDRIGDIQGWCRTVAANLPTLTYQERRTALDVLGVAVRVWRRDHDPRYKIRASIPLDEAAPQTPRSALCVRRL